MEGGGFMWTPWGLCLLQRIRYLGKVELRVNRQILFVWGLSVQNQACGDGSQKMAFTNYPLFHLFSSYSDFQ